MITKDIEIGKIKFDDNSRVNSHKQGQAELMASIKELGLLHPIVVSPAKKGYIVVCGHRRLGAFKKLSVAGNSLYKKIPATIMDKSSTKKMMIANIVENIQREDVSMAELGRYFLTLKTKHKMSTGEIAVATSKYHQYVEQAIRVFRLVPDEFVKDIKTGSQGGKKQGSITPNEAIAFTNFVKSCGPRKITIKNKILLLNKLKAKEIKASELSGIARGVNSGSALEEVLKSSIASKIHVVRLSVTDKTAKKFKKKHNTTVRGYIIKLLKSDKNLKLTKLDFIHVK